MDFKEIFVGSVDGEWEEESLRFVRRLIGIIFVPMSHS